MPSAPTGTIVGFDHTTREQLFEVKRPTALAGKSTLPGPGELYVNNDGKRYRVIERLADATDKVWKISVIYEGPSAN